MAYSLYGDHHMVIIKDGCTTPVFETTDPAAAIKELSRLNRQDVNSFAVPSRIDSRFVAYATRHNSDAQFKFSFYSNGNWVCDYGFESQGFTEFDAQIHIDKFAKKILERIKAGNPYKIGDAGRATAFLNA